MPLRDIIVIPAAHLATRLHAAVDIIDAMHEVSLTQKFPLQFTRSRREQGCYLSADRPRRTIAVQISLFADHPELTLVHEIGHLLDHTLLNPIGSGFASENGEPRFDPFLSVLGKSALVPALQNLFDRYVRRVSPSARHDMRMQLGGSELWARAYAQWLALRSGHPTLLSQLREVRLKGSYFGGRHCTFYWEDDDFKAIMEAVDNIMSDAGLL